LEYWKTASFSKTSLYPRRERIRVRGSKSEVT